jgi:CBS domain-containing protein
MLVKNIMTEKPITVTMDTEIFKAAKILLDNRINGLPVVDEQREIGGDPLPKRHHRSAEKTSDTLAVLIPGRLYQPQFHEGIGKGSP